MIGIRENFRNLPLKIQQISSLLLHQSSSSSSQGDHKKKKRCNYCRVAGHDIAECRKRIASEEEEEEKGLAVSTASGNDATPNEHAHFATEQSWSFIVQCHYDPSVHDASDACMLVSASTWFFDSGASKHVTSCKTLLTSLADAPKWVFCDVCQQCMLYG